MALGEVVISRRFGSEPRRYSALGLRASKEVSRAGILSCLIPLAAIRANGWPDLKGRWLMYDHPSGFRWGGVITADRRRPGSWEVAAETWHVLLRKRRTPRLSRTLTATPGALFLRSVGDVDNGDPLGLASIQADEDGDAVRLDARAMDLYGEVIPALVRSGGFEWDVDTDRNAVFRRRIGTDRRATVHLCEGRHIVDFSLDGDLWTITNDLLGVPAKQGFVQGEGQVKENGTSIRAYGRLQDTVVLGERSVHTINPVVSEMLARLKDPLSTLSMTLANQDGCFGRFGVGDTVRVTLGSAGVVVAYRPMSVALDEESGVMSCSGDVVSVISEAA